MNPSCPLCYSENIHEIETLQVADLKKSYKKMLGDSISGESVGIQKIPCMRCEKCDLNFFNPAITGSEKFYKKLQKIDWRYMDEKDESDYVKRLINEGGFCSGNWLMLIYQSIANFTVKSGHYHSIKILTNDELFSTS